MISFHFIHWSPPFFVIMGRHSGPNKMCWGHSLYLTNSINSIEFKFFLQMIVSVIWSANFDKSRKQLYTSPNFVPILLYWFVVIPKLSSIFWRYQGITWWTVACKVDAQPYKYFFKPLCWSFWRNRSCWELKSRIGTGKNKPVNKQLGLQQLQCFLYHSMNIHMAGQGQKQGEVNDDPCRITSSFKSYNLCTCIWCHDANTYLWHSCGSWMPLILTPDLCDCCVSHICKVFL